MTKKGEKYANMKPIPRFFHKYTGYIIMGAALLCLFVYWEYYKVEGEFYSQWTCLMLWNYENGGATFKGVMYDDLSDDDRKRYDDFVQKECGDNTLTFNSTDT